MRRRITWVALVVWGGLQLAAADALAAQRADRLLPAHTKGFVSVANAQRLQQAWDQIALGKLVADPVAKPFIEDLQRQIESRIDRTGIRIGIRVEELLDVCTGEVALGFVEPEQGTQRHAVAAIADVTGKEQQVARLREKVRQAMETRDATRQEKTLQGVDLEIYTVPLTRGSRGSFQAVVFVAQDTLVATDYEPLAESILEALLGGQAPVLADQPTYITTMARSQRSGDATPPHLTWFAEPLGYARVAREAASLQKRRRNDILAAAAKQGFDAVKGIGGQLLLESGNFEILHQTYVYAPPLPEAGDEKYVLAARMLNFPGEESLDVQDWVPDTISSYVTATWRLQDAYRFVDTLIDEIAGDQGFFQDLKASLLEDPQSPQIDLDKEIVAHLGDRVTVITDCSTPITPQSERFLVAISLSNPEGMQAGVEKALESDPDARPHEIHGHRIWEIINEAADAPDIDIEADGFASFGALEIEAEEEAMEIEPLMSNAAISVVHGHLMISSHVDFIVEIMQRDLQAPGLDACQDYQAMLNALAFVGSDKDVARVFSRVDEELYPAYELIRQGRMPESEGLMGKILNAVLGPKEKGAVRSQEIDGSKMPDYQVVRRYLGTAGAYLAIEEEGSFGVAIGLPKDAPMHPTTSAKLTTAGRDVDKN